jgi:hypothetical protein
MRPHAIQLAILELILEIQYNAKPQWVQNLRRVLSPQ